MLNGQIANLVTEFATEQGRPSVLVGFADARDAFGADEPALPYRNALSVAVALDAGAVATVKEGPTREYYDEVVAVQEFVRQLERQVIGYLNRAGYVAARLTDVQAALAEEAESVDAAEAGASSQDAAARAHRMVAAHAGLGWIGKNNLIITKHFGSAVMLGCVLTDAPVECGKEVFLSRCGRCVECILACPAGAINNAEWSGGADAVLVDEEACAAESCAQSVAQLGFEADICGACIWACPYTKSYLSRNGLRNT